MLVWNELRRVIPNGEVLVPGEDGYAASVERWSTAVEIKSAIVVKPTCALEVSSAIRFAVANKLPLAVCGGGHSTSGASSSEGIVIHLGNMCHVDIDESSMMMSFGGGCRWADVDQALEARGLATVGGAVNHTGVGGLILGGGHGWLTAKHGLTIDNLLSVQIVTADGSILEASDSHNSDLFWGVRGAGAQLGVVTCFRSRIHHQERVWSGTLLFPPEKLSEVVGFANEFHSWDNRQGHCLTVGIGHSLDGNTPIVSVLPLYHGPEGEARRYFSNLLIIGPVVESTGMMSIAEVNTLQNPMAEYGLRRLQGSGNVTMPINVRTLQQIADAIWSFGGTNPDITVSGMAIELFPTHKLREVAHDATAYANRGDYYDAVTVFGWTDPELDTTVRELNRKVCEQIRHQNGFKGSQRQGGGISKMEPVGRYLNMEAASIKPLEAYGSNLARLQQLKMKFDPGNVFHKGHGVGVPTGQEEI